MNRALGRFGPPPFNIVRDRVVGGVRIVEFSAPTARNMDQVLAIMRTFAIGARRVIASANIALARVPGFNRWVPLAPGDLVTPQAALQSVMNLIVHDENNPGSETLIQPDGNDPTPDFSRFSITLAPEGDAGPNIAPVDPQGFANIFRIPNIRSNRLNGGVFYKGKRPQFPWVFQTYDGSEDPNTYDDPQNCLDRTLDIVGLPRVPQDENTDTFETIKTLAAAQGKTLLVVDPYNYLPFMDGYEERYGLITFERSQQPKRPFPIEAVKWKTFDPQKFVILFFDGHTHVSAPIWYEHKIGPLSLEPTPGYWLSAYRNLYYPLPNVKAKEENIPLHPPPVSYRTLLSPEWNFKRVSMDGQDLIKQADNGKSGVLTFDFETVVDDSDILKPYSVSWLITEVDPETWQPLAGPLEEARKDFQSQCNFYYWDPNESDDDAAVHLAKQILSMQLAQDDNGQPTHFKELLGVSFNGSKFDNILLYEAFLKISKENESGGYEKLPIKDEFWMGSSLINFTIAGYFKLFDIRRHLVGSLDKCVKDFKLYNQKKGADLPSFEDIQEAYDYFGLSEMKTLRHEYLLPKGKTKDDYPDGVYPQFIDMLKYYNDMDVAATAELFFSYRANNLVPGAKSIGLHLPATLASETFQSWSAFFKTYYGTISKFWPPLPYALYDEIRSTSVAAGRTQCFHEPRFWEGPCVSMDVTSLYPYVMAIAPVYYPCGKWSVRSIHWSPETTVVEFPKITKLGLYKVNVDQSHLEARDLPPIILAKKAIDPNNPKLTRNDWHAPVSNNIWITTKEMEVLLAFGCKVEVMRTLLYDSKIKSCDLFQPLLRLMEIKNQEDVWKAAGDPRYNAARRTASKLAQNALYGKMMEGYHLDSRITVDWEKWKKIVEDISSGKMEMYTDVSAVYPVGDELVCDVKKNPENKSFKLNQRPMVLGFFILAYARMYMYEEAYSILGLEKCIYTDTDAIKCTKADFESTLRPHFESKIIPHWPEVEAYDSKFKTAVMYGVKAYGGFENELDGNLETNAGLWVIAKKMWACQPAPMIDGRPSTHEDWKLGTKGVTKSDVFLTPEEFAYLEECRQWPARYANEFKRLYETKEKRIYNNPLPFFQSLCPAEDSYELGTAVLLKRDFKKHVTQLRKNVKWDKEGRDVSNFVKNFGAMSQVYTVTTISPGKNLERDWEKVDQDFVFTPLYRDELSE
jgi:hypothetical protein